MTRIALQNWLCRSKPAFGWQVAFGAQPRHPPPVAPASSGPSSSSPGAPPQPTGLLGDTPQRDYSRKLALFNAFAAPELRRLIAGLGLRPGMRVLDAGCGTGESLAYLAAAVAPRGLALGLDLAAAHARAARLGAAADAAVIQADLARAPLRPASLDLIWSVNTINHLRDPLAGTQALADLLRPGGRIALGQSLLLPELVFAWDARLERAVDEAVRRYYRVRYGAGERDLTWVRALVGLLRRAGLRNVTAHSTLIERVSPLSSADKAYLTEAIFQNTWGERLRPYLDPADYAELERLCDPAGAAFCLRREDFHYLQSFTVVVGERATG